MMASRTKTILITGCSADGIGSATASALAKKGHHVFATARDLSKISPELVALPGVTTVQLDITSPESVAAAVKTVETAANEQQRGLDVIVNNAGVGYTIPILDMDLEKAKKVHDTNVWGTVRVTQAFAPLLIARRGRVVNVSTVGAVVNTPWIGVYSSSKAALNILSDTMRLELAPFGVSVLTVMVGTVTTPFHANEPVPELPPTSRYAGIKDIITRWATGEAGPKGCSAEELAESLVGDIVASEKSGEVWKGPNSGAVKFLSRWVPTGMLDRMMSNGQGLDELTKAKGT